MLGEDVDHLVTRTVEAVRRGDSVRATALIGHYLQILFAARAAVRSEKPAVAPLLASEYWELPLTGWTATSVAEIARAVRVGVSDDELNRALGDLWRVAWDLALISEDRTGLNQLARSSVVLS